MSKLVKTPEVGKIYRDTEDKEQYSTYLEYIGTDEDGLEDFRYAGGIGAYIILDGLIPFQSIPNIYELNENESYGFLG